jgi:uncharacterized integral membrane protein (TIGR00697 family)
MNEALFFFHIILVMAFGFGALKMGKTALSTWVALQAVLANLFVIKQICFLEFHVTCSDVFAVGSIFGFNLLREYHGQKAAKRALWICFFAMIFFAVMAQIHLFYLASSFDTSQQAFEVVLSSSPRLLATSLIVFILVQQIDLHLFGIFKKKFQFLPLSLRNAFSVSITQFLDTFLFSILGLWGLVAHLSDIILISFLIKLLVIALMSPLMHFSKRFVRYEDLNIGLTK